MIGSRLKEERERLGYTQPAFAELAGAKKRTLIDWEKGVSSPTAVQLSALAGVGADVLYILTGQRGGAIGSAASAPVLARDEEALLDNYRNSSSEGQAIIRSSAEAAQSAAAVGAGSRRRGGKKTA